MGARALEKAALIAEPFRRHPVHMPLVRERKTPMLNLSGTAQSFWVASVADDGPDFAPLAGDLEVDVAIVGGGIVGLTAALLLQRAGRRTAVLEALRIGQQVTGRSTAKVTSQHGLIYQRL